MHVHPHPALCSRAWPRLDHVTSKGMQIVVIEGKICVAELRPTSHRLKNVVTPQVPGHMDAIEVDPPSVESCCGELTRAA